VSRSVPEWVGRTADSPVPERVLERLWKACGGRCKCWLNLSDQAWDADHIVALINWIGEGHGNRESNLQVLGLKCCHRPKTKEDMKIKWQTSRKVRSHAGIKRPRNPMPGSKRSNMKKCADGTVIDRRTGRKWGT
jgi:5-methylcytosine-specific restriction protein A